MTIYALSDSPQQPERGWAQAVGGFYISASGSDTLHSPPLPSQTAAVVLDDRNLPIGQVDASAFLAALSQLEKPLLIADFERAYHPALAQLLIEAAPLAGAIAVPQTYAALPHTYLFCAPYVPTEPFADWLCRNETGLLDMKPVTCTLCIGEKPEPITFRAIGSLLRTHAPRIRYVPSLFCCCFSYMENETPIFVLFDTPQTYARKLDAAGRVGTGGVLLLASEYQAMCEVQAEQ